GSWGRWKNSSTTSVTATSELLDASCRGAYHELLLSRTTVWRNSGNWRRPHQQGTEHIAPDLGRPERHGNGAASRSVCRVPGFDCGTAVRRRAAWRSSRTGR